MTFFVPGSGGPGSVVVVVEVPAGPVVVVELAGLLVGGMELEDTVVVDVVVVGLIQAGSV